MGGVAIKLGQAVVTDVFTIFLTLSALFLVFRTKINSTWLILGGGLLGMAYKLLIP